MNKITPTNSRTHKGESPAAAVIPTAKQIFDATHSRVSCEEFVALCEAYIASGGNLQELQHPKYKTWTLKDYVFYSLPSQKKRETGTTPKNNVFIRQRSSISPLHTSSKGTKKNRL